MTTEPTTQSGRELIAAYPANAPEAASPEFIRHQARAILAIEREARAALLDELEAAVRGMEFANCGGYGCAGERAEDREQLFALIQQHREGNP